MYYPFFDIYSYYEHVETPKEKMLSNKTKMATKAKKESEKYRLIKK